jgi:hypothetical protein
VQSSPAYKKECFPQVDEDSGICSSRLTNKAEISASDDRLKQLHFHYCPLLLAWLHLWTKHGCIGLYICTLRVCLHYSWYHVAGKKLASGRQTRRIHSIRQSLFPDMLQDSSHHYTAPAVQRRQRKDHRQ